MMELIRLKLVLVVIINLIVFAAATTNKCSLNNLSITQCGENEHCQETTKGEDIGECHCKKEYKRVGSKCVSIEPPKEDVPTKVDEAASGGHSRVVGVLVPLVLVVAVIAGIYYGWKHQVVGWLRYKINQRYNNNYDDVMLGQDDD